MTTHHIPKRSSPTPRYSGQQAFTGDAGGTMRTPDFSESGLELHNCDCMELMAQYPDKHFDLAIVDPPYFKGVADSSFYGSLMSGTGVKRLQSHSSHWDANIPHLQYWNEIIRVSKDQIIWGINYFNFPVSSGRIIWDKKNDDSTFSNCEIAFCSKEKHVKIWRHMWNGMLRESEQASKRIHPTQKPVALYSWLLNKYATPEATILDTHLGSGSIAIACRRFGNSLVASEIDADYFKGATDRIKRELDQKLLPL